ncbi:MAG: type II secretion system F family protein [Pseudomonadota bacterium]|nr:type II secretion system F family protein [Pseudomonadota bacterium]
MPIYAINVRVRGKVKVIEVNAGSPEIARKQARRFGTVLSIGRKRRSKGGTGMRASERYIFMIRLATMLAAKVGATESLRLMRDSFGGKISNCAAGLLEKVELGIDLPTAIAEDKRHFPGAIGLIVKVGAQSGQTHRALREAAEFERRIYSVRKTSNRGVIAAVLSFIIAGALLVTSTMYIGPEISKMSLVAANKEHIKLEWVNQMAWWGGACMAVMVAILLGFFGLGTIGRKLFPSIADAIILKIPYYRDMILAQDNFINLHRLGLLARSGVRMEDALTTSLEGSKPGALKNDFSRSLDALRKGQKWASGMHTLHPTDRAALMLSSDRDQIADNLESIAEQYQALYIQRVSTFAPIMTISAAIAVTVAGVVLFGQSVLPMLQVAAGMMSE